MSWCNGLLSWLLVVPVLAWGQGARVHDANWETFKARFVMADGRVVDEGNGGISHSEGQGVTMLLAVRHNDRPTFEAVWRWTREKLQVRDDPFFAWRWVPGAGVTDTNNAADGDVFVAWALLRAYRQWGDVAAREASLVLLRAIRASALRETDRGPVLLPGQAGFDLEQGVMVNLSYWVFPAFAEFEAFDPDARWGALRESGSRLLSEGRFGRWGLPVDWMFIRTPLEPAGKARFGYDAVRIPLYLVWARMDSPSNTAAFHAFWNYFQGASFVPAWTDVRDDSVDSYNASAGIRAVGLLLRRQEFPAGISWPPLDTQQDYYSSLLLLLAQSAHAESQP